MRDPVQAIQEVLQRHPGGSIHLMGIGGVGMAGLASFLQHRGFQVSGCDLETNRFTSRLQDANITVRQGHDPAHLDADPILLIRSTAVPKEHPEILRAHKRAIPVYRRGEVFPALLRDEYTIAISGTHGKTTTTALSAHVLRACGRSPCYFVGGEWGEAGRVFDAGTESMVIAEADESDGTLIHYRPNVSVITGIDYDHMEHFADETEFVGVFRRFIEQTTDRTIICADDARLRSLVTEHTQTISYGFASDADVRATEIEESAERTSFTVAVDGSDAGRFVLPLAGRHNVQNALTALAVAQHLKIPMEQAGAALSTFRPVRRRFERLGAWHGVPVYSDYAHHPTEIKALIGAARQLQPRRLLAIFQPHRYSRTRALGRDFPPAFAGVDHVVLAPIYAASEPPLEGGRLEDLATHFREDARVSFEASDDLDHAWRLIEARAEPGDVLLLVGAGNIERLGVRVDQP